MASSSSSSSSSPSTWRYNVFTSFHGPDVRKTFLSHLRKQFGCNGISMFDDRGIERSHTIGPALARAVKESRISIVLLSKNFASSSWCLEELLKILKCKDEDTRRIVMTIFYGVDPSDVRKQTGDFGIAFDETCEGKSEEERRNWSKALNDVGNIAGEHSLNWDNESEMIEKIARDVSNKLNATVSRDFEDMVGIEAHLEKMQSLLELDNEDEALIVGIIGPAGIGKTTIARALHARLSTSFQLTCFMENVRGSYNRGIDEYGWKLSLQEQLLAKILNHNDGMRIYNLGAIRKRLCDQKVLIILDDVDDMKQLEALAEETNWFGPGSRVVITTEDGEILEKRGINTYHVGFPNEEEACKIFWRYAFRGSLGPVGFEKLIQRVTKLCCNLPLGLRVMGSFFLGKREGEWESILQRLEDTIDLEIEGVLRVGYDSLHKNDQFLFLLIAFFFNYQDEDHVMAMLADSNLDVRFGLRTLAYKSLIQKSTQGNIVMHKLLQQVGREAVQRQDPSKRQILIDNDDICDILENDSGRRSVTGISFDISSILDGVDISAGAFKKMRNLRFLSVHKTKFERYDTVQVPEDMDFPPRLKLLHWEVYPGKCLTHTFCPEHLVELNLGNSQLEKLWPGTQPLTNLKKMVLAGSLSLKEVPDLSNATNLKRLDLTGCWSLVEIPPSIGNLHKLEELEMNVCTQLQDSPAHFNLASLESLRMVGCWQMRKMPDISANIISLAIGDTMLQESLESISRWSRLETLNIYGSVITKTLAERRGAEDIERIPEWIKDLHGLKSLYIAGCPKLASLPTLPRSLRRLVVDNCESLETVSFPFDSPSLYFPNCFKLGLEARRVISERSFFAYLTGKEIPREFDHRAMGSSLTVRPSLCRFRICLVLSPRPGMEDYVKLICRMRRNGSPSDADLLTVDLCKVQAEHLYIFHTELIVPDKEILFKFSTSSHEVEITECGLQILKAGTNEV